MSPLARRELLLMGTAGAAALASCTDPYAGPAPVSPVPDGWDRGEERHVATTCGRCPAGCGVRARVREGLAIGIEGDPRHPVNRGGLGPKGRAGLQELYHPERVRAPMAREGPRGSGRWKPITWDEALGQLAAELRVLRERAPEELVVVDGEPRGIVHELWARFLRAYGSPNHVVHGWTRYAAKRLAMEYACGVHELPAFDWPGTRYVLCFGSGLFESWCQTIHLTRVASEQRRGAPKGRVQLVQASSRFSVSAAKADEWLPLEPGTHGALALGLAHVMVRDGLYDERFVRERTFGFEEWADERGETHRGFKRMVLEDHAPESAARVSGVSAEEIERVAHEMSRNAPAIAVTDAEAEEASNGLETVLAVHALNALLGNLDRPGGMGVPRRVPLAPWEELEQDEIARAGCATARADGAGGPGSPLGRVAVDALPEALLAGRARVGALVFAGANPIFAGPDPGGWERALEHVQLVVSLSSFPDETTRWADLLLPESVYLERAELVEAAPSDGRSVLSVRRPVVATLHDTLPAGEVLVRLARAVGAPLSGALPWKDYAAAIEARVGGVSELADIEETSSWQAPPGGPPDFATPSGRYELFSQRIAERLTRLDPADGDPTRRAARAAAERGDEACLPQWRPPRVSGNPETYPLLLVPYRGIEYAEGATRRLSLLRELPAAGRHAWEPRLDIGPDLARSLGVEDGEEVRVESPAGRARLHARIDPGLRPGLVALPLGQVRPPPQADEPASCEGLGLLAAERDALTGIRAVQGTRVRVWKEQV